jgi:hypothetical protein
VKEKLGERRRRRSKFRAERGCCWSGRKRKAKEKASISLGVL